MRETISSMKAYLILSGLLGILSHVRQAAAGDSAIAMAMALVGVALSLTNLYIDVSFRRLIVHTPALVAETLKFRAAFLTLIVSLALVRGDRAAIVSEFEATSTITVRFGDSSRFAHPRD